MWGAVGETVGDWQNAIESQVPLAVEARRESTTPNT